MLFLPAGVKNAGLATAMTILLIIGAIVMRCILLLLRCERMLAAQGKRCLGFGDVGYHVYGRAGCSSPHFNPIPTPFQRHFNRTAVNAI